MVPKEARKFVQEKNNVLDILNTAIKAIKKQNFHVLKDLSNRTIHSASIYQDSDSVAVAVIIYTLSKIFERGKYIEYSDWQFFSKKCIAALKRAKDHLKADRLKEFRESLQEIRKTVNELSGNLKKYIGEVFRKAMISKASRIYEHGISMQQTAEILGVSIWELSEYTGKTGIGDVNLGITLDIKTRIEKAMELFK